MTAPGLAERGYREWTIWVVDQPELSADGIRIAWEGATHAVAWSEIDRAFAAEVGEPEGVRAMVFDLAWSGAPDAPAILRFSVDPSEGPKRPAQHVVEALGAELCSDSLRALANDGRPTEHYSHIDFLDEALLTWLAARG